MRPEYVEDEQGRLIRAGAAGDVLARVHRGNLLRDTTPIETLAAGGRVVAWSGTLAETLFEPHPPTWLTPGHETLAAVCATLAPRLAEAGVVLCLRPHARHVLNDPWSCLRFLDGHPGGPFEIALDPAALLEASMLEDAADHLERILETLGARCAMVIVDRERAGSIEPLVERFVPVTTPIARTGPEAPLKGAIS